MQVLMLDSDNLPLRNPEDLFEAAEYRRSGTLFFSDWWDLAEWVKPQAYTAFGLPYPGQERALLAAESGQLLLNRRARSHPNHMTWNALMPEEMRSSMNVKQTTRCTRHLPALLYDM